MEVSASRAAQIDELFSPWDSTHTAGCAVAVIHDGHIIYSRGYGMADLEHGAPITPRTVFSLASVSKQFTAAAVMLLVEQGKVRLDDDIRKYLPELPDYARGVRVRHLLHHTSGLRDYFQLRALAGKSEADAVSSAEVLRLLAGQRGLNFKPGERYAYSNTGYEFLGQIVERASGQSLRAFAAENIFAPLGMSRTQFYDDRSLIVADRAIGHQRNADGSLGIFRSSFALAGSGGLLSTVEDLARWDLNFYDNVLGKGGPAFVQSLLATETLNDGTPNGYAAGLAVRSYRGLPTVRHAGRSFGFRSEMVRFPQQRFSVIVLSNLYEVDPGALVDRISELFLADAFTEVAPLAKDSESRPSSPAPVDLSAAELARYAGRYYSPELAATYVVEIADGGLSIHPELGQAQQYRPIAKQTFVSVLHESIRVRFARSRGHVQGFSFDHGAIKDLRFERQR
jgi:CubicO group peptidase (beta-lactamase class C family)